MRFPALLLALAVLAGCSTGRTNTDNNLRGELRLAASALSPDQTIVENAMTQPELSSLVAALRRADLVDALSGPGPYTVFAPINEAFSDMDLGSANPETLGQTLQYHVVEGDISAADLVDGETLVTLTGDEIIVGTVTAGDPMLMVNDADIVYPDIVSSNGRVHLINLVLDPTRGGLAR